MPEPPVDAGTPPPSPGRPARLGRPARPPLAGQLRNLGLLLVLSVVVVVVGIAISSRIRPPVSLLQIGSRAPVLAPAVGGGLPAVDQVASRAGAAFVIEFFKSDCPACEQAAPGLCDLLGHHPAATLVEVDAAFESDQAVAGYRQDRFAACSSLARITFLADPCTARDQNGLCTVSAHLLWKVEATPTVYVVDAGGTLVFAGVGSGTPAAADDALTRVTASSGP